MAKKIFKVGNYGAKGNYTKEKLESWIGKEFSITAGHVNDWVKSGYPVTAIPVAGTCKAVGVDNDGYLLGEFSYNKYGESIKESYPNVSLGIDDNGPNHIALLGYAKPHIDSLDKSFSEFATDLTGIENTKNIEFSETSIDVDDFVNRSESLGVDEKIKIANALISKLDVTKLENNSLGDIVNKVWDIQDKAFYVEKLKEAGYIVEKTQEFSKETLKTVADSLGIELKEKNVSTLTPEEAYKRAKAEFARESERDNLKAAILKLFPPVMKSIMEFAVDKAFEENEYITMIEFSEGEPKKTMATLLKEFSESGGPFKDLFENTTAQYDFNKDDDKEKIEDPYEAGMRIAKM